MKPWAGLLLGPPGPPQRRAIAKAITLLESTRTDHRLQADALLTALLPHTGRAFRLGISGVPGVGKSTFIEALGLYLIGQGHRVAVLTVDPSSTVSGGSILGDKTRMEQLSVHAQAYIRPSPSSGTLGGVAEKTRETMLVCEAAGYDVVMELADLVAINKADLDADAATRAQAQITSALRLFTQHGRGPHPSPLPEGVEAIADWQPQVIQLSALKAEGIDRFWAAVSRFRDLQTRNGKLAARRQHQALAWMWERIDAGLKQAFRAEPAVQALLPQMVREVEAGTLAASTAARRLLQACHPWLDPGSVAADRDMDAGPSPA